MSLLERLNRKKQQQVVQDAAPAGKGNYGTTGFATSANEAREAAYQNVKADIHARIIDEMPEDLQRIINQQSADKRELRRLVEQLCGKAIAENPFAVPLGDRERLVDELVSEVLGLGPLEALLKDSSVTEIMVNGPFAVYVERGGRLLKTDIRFRNEEHLMHIIDRIVSAVGRRVDESSPLVDARLADGSRVNVIIPPLSLIGPALTIRKFAKDVISVERLQEFGSLDKRMAEFLEACVRGRMNIVVSGAVLQGYNALSFGNEGGKHVEQGCFAGAGAAGYYNVHAAADAGL